MRILTGVILLAVAVALPALAVATVGPEIDPGSAASALTILIGLSLVRRRRRRV
jgi:hypothetical protein